MLEIQVLALDKHKNVSVLGPKPIQWQYINKQVIKKKLHIFTSTQKDRFRGVSPKVHWSEGSLVRRSVSPKVRLS